MTQQITTGNAQLAEDEKRAARKARVAMAAILGGLTLAAVIGVTVTLGFIDNERSRDLQQWQARLGIVADGRAADVRRWVDDRFANLRSLAENASLQLYMTTLGGGLGEDADAVEGAYLRNLLEATARLDGYAAPPRPAINANIADTGTSGLALVDAKGALLIATAGMPPPPPEMRAAMERAANGRPGLMDMMIGAHGRPVIGFAVPVYTIQADPGTSPHAGFIIGIRLVDRDLFERLEQPGDTSASDETYLVRRDVNEVVYLSALADGSEPLKRRLAADTPELAAAFAIDRPGGFDLKRDYAGRDVLVTGRPIASTPWTLVRKIDRNEALADTDSRLKTILTFLLLVIGGILAAAWALWRHGTSVRLAQVAARHRLASERFENLLKFLRLVTDSQRTEVMCVNPDGLITFANKPLAAHYGIPIVDIKYKPVVSVLGPVKTRIIAEINKRVVEQQADESHLHRFEEADGSVHVIATDHVYIPPDSTHPAAALVVFNDITELMSERARAERTTHDLVRTLVGLVDSRDPYSAHQSARVAQVARAIATEMGADEAVVQTVESAGNLMNLGKILVPPEILTKTGRLTDQELAVVRRAMLRTADLLRNIDFRLPVPDTLRQVQEHWDGTGYPEGLAGESILLPARIVAVANAFVSMVSPRAFRDAMEFHKAMAILAQDVGARYDRRPVTALANHIDNRGGLTEWDHFRRPPQRRRRAAPPAEAAETPAPADETPSA